MSRKQDLHADQDKFVLRLPDGMRQQIYEEAKNQRRSMNMEIIHRLQSSLEQDQEIKLLKAALRTALEANQFMRELQGAAA